MKENIDHVQQTLYFWFMVFDVYNFWKVWLSLEPLFYNKFYIITQFRYTKVVSEY